MSPPQHGISLLGPDDPRLADVERLFGEMYQYQERHGLLLPLAPDGAARWLSGVRATLGRLGCLVGAGDERRLVGFLHAGLSPLPEYLGGGRVGRISHVFVSAGARRGGVGRRLVESGVEWLAARGAGSVELQVLVSNTDAVAFWRALGWAMELHQLRLELTGAVPGTTADQAPGGA